jgi:hypothetical protein
VFPAFPAALDAFPELTAVSALAFLERWERWPTAAAARDQERAAIEAFFRQQFHSQARAAAGRIHAALQADTLTAPPHLAVGRRPSGRDPARRAPGAPPAPAACRLGATPGSNACVRCSTATEPTLTARSC